MPADGAWTTERRGIRPRTMALWVMVVFLAALVASLLGAGTGAALTL